MSEVNEKRYISWATSAIATYTLEVARAKAREVAAGSTGRAFVLEVLEVAEKTTPPVVVSPYQPTT